MFGTYEDNVMICRRKIAQTSESSIIIGKRNLRSTEIERVDDDSGEQYYIQRGEVDKNCEIAN